MGTGYVWHELYGWHDTGSSAEFVYGNAPAGLQPYRHYDSVDSKKRLHELVAVCGRSWFPHDSGHLHERGSGDGEGRP